MRRNRLNILMICHKSRLQAYARSHAIAAQLVARGHRVTLLLHSTEARFGIKSFMWEGVRAVEMPDLLWGRLRSGWDPWNTVHRIFFLSREKEPFDLAHCFETRPATIFPALFLIRKDKIPWLTDWNDWCGRGGLIEINRPRWYRYLFGRVETYFEEAFRAKADGLTVISTALAERAYELGLSPGQIRCIPGGCFPNWFQARSKEECRRRVGLRMDAKVLGFSSLDSHFDLEIVLSALKKVVTVFPNLLLLITGKPRPSVRDMVKNSGMEEFVRFSGFLSFEDLPWHLGCADLFLLPMEDKPYNRGRWPNKMGEYMSLGRPTISNPVGDIKKLFERKEVGLLADWAPEDFAEKILQLLRDQNLAMRCGEVARQVAVKEYSWSKLAGEVEKFYYDILSRRNC